MIGQMGYIQLAGGSPRRLQEANFCHFHDPLVHYDRVLDVHDLIFLVEGGWEIFEEGTAFTMHPGDVLFLAAGRHHYGRTPSARDTRTLYLHWHPLKGDRYLTTPPASDAEGTVGFPSLVRASNDYTIRSLFERIIRLYWSSDPLNRMIARTLCGELSIELARNGKHRSSAKDDGIARCIAVIESHPDRLFSLDELAEMGGMSRRSFSERFRRTMGASPHRYQLELRIRMACALLKSTPRVTLRVVAATFGFTDEFHFSKIFKSVTGIPPRQYRESLSVGQKGK
jgi:AraC-like DNA-binding protein